MGKISGSHCLVLGCRNRQLLNQTNTRSYFRFPRCADLCKKWVDFCNRPELYKKYDENGPEYLYKSSRICSDHFQPTDFNNPNLYSQGLKKGSIPTVNPASSEAKTNNNYNNHNGTGGIGGAGGGGGGGSGSSNGAGSPVDEKLLSAMASVTNMLPADLTLMAMASIAAVQQQLLPAAGGGGGGGSNATSITPVNLKRAAAALSASATNTTSSSNNGTSNANASAKRIRAVPPLATPTGALANLIQRHQQIKEQQQRKAAVLAASGLVNGQVSITPASAPSRTSPSTNNNHHHHNNSRGPLALVTKKAAAANNINNNNNNSVSNNNNNHSQHGKSQQEAAEPNHNEYGLNMIDMDMTESSEGDSSYQNSADEDFSYHQKRKVAKVEAVIPPSLKSELTVTPATIGNSSPGGITTTTTITTINNNTIHQHANGGGVGGVLAAANGGIINYKEKYEQTLNELFACRKIVKNQNKAIKQLQGEIDFLNQLLKEK